MFAGLGEWGLLARTPPIPDAQVVQHRDLKRRHNLALTAALQLQGLPKRIRRFAHRLVAMRSTIVISE